MSLKYVRNVAEVKYGFVKLVWISLLFTMFDYMFSSPTKVLSIIVGYKSVE